MASLFRSPATQCRLYVLSNKVWRPLRCLARLPGSARRPFRMNSPSPSVRATAVQNFTRLYSTAAVSVEAQDKTEIADSHRRSVAIWLFVCAGLVFCMVVLGGVTRLTESGLSITDWRPITGTLPPLSEHDWEEEFNKYKNSPEFKLIHSWFQFSRLNADMTLSEYKRIYYYEWAHRFLGRAIGVVFAVPLIYFSAKGYLTPALKKKFAILFGLGGMQGAIGWWMVKSGLEEDLDHPRVSPYRLAVHLGSAFVIYVLLLQSGLSLVLPARLAVPAVSARIKSGAHAVMQMTFWTAMAGAFVAGLDAGTMYNQFPFMGEKRFTPVEYWELEPKWKNIFENGAAVQFNHRALAMLTYTTTMSYYFWALRQPVIGMPRVALHAMAAMVNTQVALGIATLLYVVPVPLAATHQAGSLTLLSITTWLFMLTRRIPRLPM